MSLGLRLNIKIGLAFSAVFIGCIFALPTHAQTGLDTKWFQSIVQVQIYDNFIDAFVSQASGISLDGMTILTNYHVVEDVINSPGRYSIVVCVADEVDSVPNCVWRGYLDRTAFGASTNAIYDRGLDLAIVNLTHKYKNGEWQDFWTLAGSDLILSTVTPALYGFEMTGVSVGNEIYTLGYPDFGAGKLILSSGKVTSIGTYSGAAKLLGIDAHIGPGSSGGAVFSKDGKFLGVTSGGREDSNGVLLEAIAIPISTFNWWWEKALGHRIDSFGTYSQTDPEWDEVMRQALCLLAGGVYNESMKQCGQAVVASCSASSQYLLVNGQCADLRGLLDAGCKENFGHSSWTGQYDTQQRYVCDCQSGYTWKAAENSCKGVGEENTVILKGIDSWMNATKLDDKPIFITDAVLAPASYDYSSATELTNAPSINVDRSLQPSPEASTCKSDSLIKASGPAVYYCGSNGKRYVFPNEGVYKSWYSNFLSVVTISDAALAKIQIGGNVTYRPGAKMIKITSDPRVYVIGRGGVLRAIPDEQAARDLYGTDWNKKIDDVSEAYFINYKVGTPIQRGAP